MTAAAWRKTIIAVIVFGTLAFRGAQFVRWAGTVPGNFTAFYLAGRLVAEGHRAQLYSFPAEVKTLKGLGLGPADYYFWIHPPYEALALQWVKPLSYGAAAKVWAVLMLIILAICLWLLRDTDSLGYVVMGILLWGRRGVVDQDIAVLLLFLVLSFLAFRRGRDGVGGALLAGGLLRFNLIWLFPAVLLLKRRWRALECFSAVAACLGGISLWMVGPSIFEGYLATLSFTARNDNFVLYMMPTARGYAGWILPQSPWFVPVLSCVVAGPVIVAWMWQPWDRTPAWEVMFAATVVIGLAISYHSFFYDVVVLLLPISVLAKKARSPGACVLFALIPVVLVFAPEAEVFPILALEMLLMLDLWRRKAQCNSPAW